MAQFQGKPGAPRRGAEPVRGDALPVGMPPWAPRSIAWLLALMFAAALLAALFVPFSRTVRGTFVLVPEGSLEYIHSPADGFIEDILAEEGQDVRSGDTLFTILTPTAPTTGSGPNDDDVSAGPAVDGDGLPPDDRFAGEGGARSSPSVEPRGPQNLLSVRSPVDGTLYRRTKLEPGDPVAAGRPLAQIARTGSPLSAAIDLPEDALPSLEPGQTVRLLLHAYSHFTFGVKEGALDRINPVPVQIGERFVVRAYADLGGAALTVRGAERPLLAGLRGDALVVVDRRPLLSHLFGTGVSR